MCRQKLCEFFFSKTIGMWLRSAVLEASLNYLLFWASSRDKCTSISSMLGTVSAEKKYSHHQWITAASRTCWGDNLRCRGPHRWALKKELWVKTSSVWCWDSDFEKHSINHNELQVWGKKQCILSAGVLPPGPHSSTSTSFVWPLSHLSYLWICTSFGRSFEVERL